MNSSEDKDLGIKGWLSGKTHKAKPQESTTGQVVLDKHRIAVLPFENISPDPADGYFADGMTEELIMSLSGVRELSVIAKTSVMKYKASPKGASEIGDELRAGTLVEGSVRKAGDRLRIAVQLIDARSENYIWAQNYDRQLDDIFAIQSEIAARITEELKIRFVGSERQRLEKKPTENTEAYTFYLRGRHYWIERTDAAMKKAVECLNQAINIDPGFALGYAGLADCYYAMAHNYQAELEPTYRMAKQYALKALELDQSLAEAHAALGAVTSNYEHKWEYAEAEYRHAIELKPSYAPAHHWYHNLLLFERRLGEAEVEIRKALELDPFSSAIKGSFIWNLYYRKEFDSVIEQMKSVRALFLVEHSFIEGFIVVCPYVHKGMYEEALRETEVFANLPNGGSFAKLLRGYVYAGMGKSDESRRLLTEAAENYRLEHLSQYMFARTYFLMGDYDDGFRWMQKGYDELEAILFFPSDFELDKVKDDPRYLAMMKKIGLDARSAK